MALTMRNPNAISTNMSTSNETVDPMVKRASGTSLSAIGVVGRGLVLEMKPRSGERSCRGDMGGSASASAFEAVEILASGSGATAMYQKT